MTAPRLLLVDDDPDMLPLISDLLNLGAGARWQIDAVLTAKRGEQRLLRDRFDAALIDYSLGSDTGIDLIARARAAGVRTPLILLTGRTERAIDLSAMEVGADDFVAKSDLTPDALERALRYAVRHADVVRRIEERELHYRALIQQSSDAILLLNREGVVMFASDSITRVTGYTPDRTIGHSPFERVHDEDAPQLRQTLALCLATPGEHFTAQCRALDADGVWRFREATICNRLDEPAVAAIVVNFRDVTDRRMAEAERDHLAAIVSSSQDAIVSTTLDGRILSWNAAAERLYGYGASDAIGRDVQMLIPVDEREPVRRQLAQVALGQQATAYETRRLRKDGTSIWVSVSISPIANAAGTIEGASSVARDITAEVETRRALVSRERELRSLFENNPVGLVRASVDGVWREVNAQICEILGYSAAELLSLPFGDIVHPDDAAATQDAYEQLRLGARRDFDGDKRYRTKQGKYIWVRVRVSPYRDASGELRYFIIAIVDISARRAMEAHLRNTVARLEALIARLPLSIWALDSHGVITFSEGRLLSRFGAKRGELVGRSQLDLYKSYPEILEATRLALAGQEVHLVVTLGDGTFETWYTPLFDDTNSPIGAVGIAIEITERLQLEAQFRQAQKMEAVGLLAGGVAHDFNNLLTAIIGFSEMALESAPEGSGQHYEVSQILKGAHSAASLTRQLLAFSRRQVLLPKVVDLNAAVRSMHGLLARVIGEDIDLMMELHARHNIFVDPGQIEQIILNLAVNARDAMPNGGELSLQTTDVVLDEAFVATHNGSSVGSHVQLAVCDTGVGMTADVRMRIFEPFFTTKDRGRGTGLGLATVYGIVKQSGGSIWVDSEPGTGTTFRLLFPVAEGAAAATSDGVTKAERAASHETILVVEDQPDVRAISRLILERSGYVVHEASRPSTALAMIRNGGLKPALLFTDVVMPEMSGRELAERLRAEVPGLKVLLTSGYTDDAMTKHQVLESDLAFLPKPFTPNELLQRVREVLGQADSRPQ
ncbi:MAG TPA: PAS domain S-box protein [Vicinamibacterales bacterium]|nr:PAS domain S-box protein [Vicinamibacterales bacterium]